MARHSTPPVHHQLLINKNAALQVRLEKGWARPGENIKYSELSGLSLHLV